MAKFFLMIIGWLLAAIGNAASTSRDRLTADELLGKETTAIEVIDNKYFVAMDEAGPARHALSGVLAVGEHSHHPVKARFPQFSVEFFTHGDYLVPVERGLIRVENSSWDIILSPGRVWSESHDGGWSRGAFPFILAGRIWNESHNAIATFLFNDTQVSDLRFQVIQESAHWSRFDAAARVPLSYSPSRRESSDEFAEELRQQLPMLDWTLLASSVSEKVLKAFNGTSSHVTTAALYDAGKIYTQPCHTRAGNFPFCRYMRHGVYSVTKTAGALLSLAWLAQTYGDDVVHEKIADHLEVTAAHDGWDHVSFLDVINMTTGVGDKAPLRDTPDYVFDADESSPVFNKFANARSRQEKLQAAFNAGNYSWGPGEVGRYNSAHTFVLAAAMDAYLKSKQGPQANLWDQVVTEVLRPAGVRHAPMMHTQEADGSTGVPIMGWGFFPTLEELTRIAVLFQNQGVVEGRTLVSPGVLKSVAVGPSQGGYEIRWDNAHGRYRYHKSFWLMPFNAGGHCQLHIPVMMGYGGNLVTLMPNGMVGLRLADAAPGAAGTYDAEGMAEVANALRPLCR